MISTETCESSQNYGKVLGAKHRHFVVQSLVVSNSVTPWTAMHQAPLSSTISQSLLKFISTELMTLSNHFILCCPSLPPALNFSHHQGLFQWVGVLHQVTKVLELQLSPSNEYSGLIFFRTDWFNLAVQGILKSLVQHHSSKSSILWCSAFFMVQLSHLYMTTGKNYSFDYTDHGQQSDISAF